MYVYLTLITDHDILIVFFKQGSTKDRVFAVYIYFTKHADEEVCQKAITGLGMLILHRIYTLFFKHVFESILEYMSYRKVGAFDTENIPISFLLSYLCIVLYFYEKCSSPYG